MKTAVVITPHAPRAAHISPAPGEPDHNLTELLRAAHAALASVERFVQLYDPAAKDLKAKDDLAAALAHFGVVEE